jgi:hypothetical protein
MVGPVQLAEFMDHAESEGDGSRRDFDVAFPVPRCSPTPRKTNGKRIKGGILFMVQMF